MAENTHTQTENQVDAGYETSQFALGTGMVMAALVGLWGTVSLVSALVNIGPFNVVKSYLAALLG